MTTKDQKLCFVVMGFGKKTDYESGRTLDLDATYQAIIKPAAEGEGLRCVRADDILHSGIIDSKMYDMLLRADLVIADISTGNVNAVYELGVRHALRPHSTIIMTESKGKLHFDLNHTSTFRYDHLGEDIGVREAARAKKDLGKLISEVIQSNGPDSPVYVYLPKLQGPKLSDEEFENLVGSVESDQQELANLIQKGDKAIKGSNFAEAVSAFRGADKIKSNDFYILQRLALATYKSKLPSPAEALREGWRLIEMLDPVNSNDPETLGIAGAIRKRLWQETNDATELDLAIKYYQRGFLVRMDYYNGENLAQCHDYRAELQSNADEALFDRISARKTRETIRSVLVELEAAQNFHDRSDRHWIYATLANCSYALGDAENGNMYEAKFYAEKPSDWEVETYKAGKSAVLNS